MRSTMFWSLRGTALALPLSTFILLLPALINGFPLIFVDTLDYIVLTPRLYRSPFYQFFVFGLGWKTFAWLPIIGQAALSSVILWYLMAVTTKINITRYIFFVAMLSSVASLAIFASFLMPDVFTGVMFCCIYLLVFHWNRFGGVDRLVIALSAILCMAVHLSHLAMALAMISVCAVVRLCGVRGISWRGLAAAVGTTATVVGMILVYNFTVFNLVALSPAGSTFLLANLIEYGPARAELRTNCPAAGYRMCLYAKTLPVKANDFLWTDGPLSALGGFGGLRTESSQIVAATIAHRPMETLIVSVRNTGRALIALAPATDVVPIGPQHHARRDLKKVYGSTTSEAFTASRQSTGNFPREIYDRLTVAGLIGAVLTLLALGASALRSGRVELLTFPIFSIAAFLGNAATCATLSGVFDRYQSRTSWMIVAGALLLAFAMWDGRQAKSAIARDDRWQTPLRYLHGSVRGPM